MKSSLFIISCFLCFEFAIANPKKDQSVDSLLGVLQQASEDTDRIKALNELALNYLELNVSKSITYAKRAYELSVAEQWKKGLIVSQSRIAQCFATGKFYDSANAYYDRALKLAQESKMIALECDVLHNMVLSYSEQGRTGKADSAVQSLINVALQLKDNAKLAAIFQMIGNVYVKRSDYRHAISYWKKSFDLQKDSITKNQFDLLHNIGIAHEMLSEFDSSIRIYRLGITISIQDHNRWEESLFNMRIGRIFQNTGYNEEAIKFFEMALWEFFNLKDMYYVGLLLNNIAKSQNSIGDFQQALKNYQESITIAEQLSNSDLLFADLNDITQVLEKMQMYDLCRSYLFRAYEAYQKNGLNEYALAVLSNIGTIYFMDKQSDTALKILVRVATVAREIESQEIELNASHMIGEIYYDQDSLGKAHNAFEREIILSKKIRNTYGLARAEIGLSKVLFKQAMIFPTKRLWYLENADDHIRNGKELSGSLQDIELTKSAYEVLYQIEYAMGNRSGAFLDFKNYINARDSFINVKKSEAMTSVVLNFNFTRKQDSIKHAHQLEIALEKRASNEKARLISIVGILTIALLTTFFLYYRKRQNSKVKTQMQQLKQEALNAQMSDHFIGNAMDSINHFIQHNEKAKASEYLILFSRLIRNVLDNAQQQMIPLSEDLAVLHDYLKLESLRFPEGSFRYSIHLDDNLDANETLIPPMIFQTLAENAIKHGFKKTEGGSLAIDIKLSNKELICTVKDNGMGRQASVSYQTNTGKRVSHGSRLAERLIRTASRYARQTSYQIVDLFDPSGAPEGTMIRFTLPLITEIA